MELHAEAVGSPSMRKAATGTAWVLAITSMPFPGFSDAVAMAHPHLCAGMDAVEERFRDEDVVQQRTSVLTHGAAHHLTACALGQQLGAVAYGQHGHAALEAR
jgi:hypothetical protein